MLQCINSDAERLIYAILYHIGILVFFRCGFNGHLKNEPTTTYDFAFDFALDLDECGWYEFWYEFINNDLS